MINADIVGIWPKVRIWPFGVVAKGHGDPQTIDWVIHDLSCHVKSSLNDFTDRSTVRQPSYEPCGVIAAEIVHHTGLHPGHDVKEQAGDAAFAYRHVCIHSHCVYFFGDRLHRDKRSWLTCPQPLVSPARLEITAWSVV